MYQYTIEQIEVSNEYAALKALRVLAEPTDKDSTDRTRNANYLFDDIMSYPFNLKSFIEIVEIVVDEEHRREGYGSNILQQFISENAGVPIFLKAGFISDTVDKTEKKVTFKTKEVSTLLGLELTDKDVETELNRLDFPYVLEDNIFTVTIPRRRLDIDANVNDIAEEIGRLYGY